MRRAALHNVQLDCADLAAEFPANNAFQRFPSAGKLPHVTEAVQDLMSAVVRMILEIEADPFGYRDNNSLMPLLDLLHVPNEIRNAERHFGQIHKMRRDFPVFAENADGGREPTCIASHDLNDSDGIQRINGGIPDDLLYGRGHVFGGGPEAGRVVGVHEIVVDRFRNPDKADRTADHGAVLGELIDRIHGIVSTDIEKRADLIFVQQIENADVGFFIRANGRQLIATGPQNGRWGLPEKLRLFFRVKQTVELDELFLQESFDPVAGAENAFDLFILPCFAIYAEKRGVDGGCRTAGLCCDNIQNAYLCDGFAGYAFSLL